MDRNELTDDTFFHGKLVVSQHRYGYRYSIDAVLLAHHAQPYPNARILDLGAGCGIVGLILAYRYPSIQLLGVELQPELAHLAELNTQKNEMADRVKIINQDLKRLTPAMLSGPVDMIVSNPPFRRLESGRINPNPQKALARHELSVTLLDVLKAAGRLLSKKGCFVIIHLSERLADLMVNMRKVGIEPKFMRMIHSESNSEGKLVLMEGYKGGRSGVKVGPPLVIHRKGGSYTKEVRQMFDS